MGNLGNPAVLLDGSHGELLERALAQRLLRDGQLTPRMEESFDRGWKALAGLFGKDYSEARRSLLKSAGQSCTGLFRSLEAEGVDLWLEKTTGQTLMSAGQMEELVDYVERKLCLQTQSVSYVPPSFIRPRKEAQQGVHAS